MQKAKKDDQTTSKPVSLTPVLGQNKNRKKKKSPNHKTRGQIIKNQRMIVLTASQYGLIEMSHVEPRQFNSLMRSPLLLANTMVKR